jgi:hypothetical protein
MIDEVDEAPMTAPCHSIHRERGIGSVDSGASAGLSRLDVHFFIEIKCAENIKGIGDREVKSYAPFIFSILATRVNTRTGEHTGPLEYINFILERTYHLDRSGFPLFPTGIAEEKRYIFVLKHNNPHIIGPDGLRAPLIKDHTTGLTWIVQRPLLSLANHCPYISLAILIVGGLYSVTALRKNDNEGHSVY